MTPAVLTIAGSDPGGGAGLQADLRAFGALGLAGWSAVTALTVQNSHGVRAVHPVAAEVLADQLTALFEDAAPAAVKIGMLAGAPQVAAVAAALRRWRPPWVVLDPVLASTGGLPLLDAAGREALLEQLLPLTTVLTPNLAEAAALTGLDDPSEAGQLLRSKGPAWVLVKGGHRAGEPLDLLCGPDGVTPLAGRRVDTPHTHGTGCALAAALAGYLALGREVPAAAAAAKELVARALARPLVSGAGRGCPDLTAAARADGPTHAERLAKLRGVYVLTDPDLRPERSPVAIVTAALDGGSTVVQLRHKHLATPELLRVARTLRHLTQVRGALLIINDRVDIALAAGADGVHLGPDDLPPAEARRLLGPDAVIGVSVSSVDEARPVAQFASYLGVGAIFGSATKLDAGPPLGVARIAEIRAAFPQHPTVAIGGVEAGNIGSVAAAGATAAAVVSAVVAAADMRAATTELATLFEAARPRG
jgi:hydroxymethylpyrimidine kinase/phosphomethylpyrimidine kinase/thiamine-phosphate diphosphorylase